MVSGVVDMILRYSLEDASDAWHWLRLLVPNIFCDDAPADQTKYSYLRQSPNAIQNGEWQSAEVCLTQGP